MLTLTLPEPSLSTLAAFNNRLVPAMPLNPSRYRRNCHSEESPLGELPADVAVATIVRIFQLLCQYASSRQYHLP